MIDRWEADGFGLFTTVRKEDEAVIGRVGLIVWNPETWKTTSADADGPTALEVGYTIGRAVLGARLRDGGRFGGARLRIERLGAKRLIALIIHGNDASATVARKLGFEHERDIMFGRRDAGLFALEA